MFGVHGVGGIVGSLLTAVFADKAISGANASLLIQLAAVAAVAVYSALATAVLLWLIRLVLPLRVSEAHEQQGLDVSVHMEHQH